MVIHSDRERAVAAASSHPTRESEVEAKKQLPDQYWKDLHKIALSYPGHEYDLKDADSAFRSADEELFLKAVRKLRDKQSVFEEYRTAMRQNQLASLEIAYPGCEQDKEKLKT